MSKKNVRQRLQDRRGQRQRQSRIVVVAAVAILAVVAVAILIALSGQKPSGLANARSYKSIPQSIDREGGIGIVIGPAGASVTLIEYSDFSCPHCRDLAPTIHQLIDTYVVPGRLRIVYKPVTFVGGPYSVAAAKATICAAEQDRGWEMQDQIWAIFESSSPNAYTDENLAARARDLGLDIAGYASCYSSSETAAAVQSVADEVVRLNVTGTPTLYINGEQLNFTGPASLAQAIESRIPNVSTGASPTVTPTK